MFDSYSITDKASVAFWREFHFKIFFFFFTLKSLRGGSLIASVEYCRNTRFMYKSALIYTGKRRLLFSLIILKKILIAQLEGCQKLTPFMYGLVSDERHFLYGIQSVTGPCFTQETPLKTEVKTVEKWPEREQEMGNRCWGQVWAESSLSFPWLVVFQSLVRLTAHYTPLLTFSYLTSLPAASQASCLSLPLCFLSLLKIVSVWRCLSTPVR